MSAQPCHRGAAPKDARLFGTKALPALASAAGDLRWLLDRGYATRSAVELVGNRHALTRRQRIAVARCVCTAGQAVWRKQHELTPEALRDRELWLDGFNILTTLETALSGGVILVGQDGCCRDAAGVHRRYRKVEETVPALRLVAGAVRQWGTGPCRWWLDEPLSNSGRLKALMLDLASGEGWDWSVDLAPSPDRVLARCGEAVATSDSAILDRCDRWVNLTGWIIRERIPRAWRLHFGAG